MDEFCNTCGDIGVPEAIVTCPQCKEIREHMYCMKIYCEEEPTNWCCNVCDSCTKQVSPASCPKGVIPSTSKLINPGIVYQDATQFLKGEQLLKESRRGSFDWEKQVATGRTKYIPVTEALKLSSGAIKSLSPRKVPCNLIPSQPKTGEYLLGRNCNKLQTVPMNFSASRDRPNFASGSSQKLNPQRHGNSEISRLQQQPKDVKARRPVNEIQVATIPANELIQKGQSAEHINAINKLSYASSPAVPHPVTKSGCAGCPDAGQRISNSENVNDRILPGLEPRNPEGVIAKILLPSAERKNLDGANVKINLPRVERTTNYENMKDNILSDVEAKTLDANIVDSSIQPYVEPSTSSAANTKNVLPVTEPRMSTAEKMNQIIVPYVDTHSRNDPAIDFLWMGRFSIQNGFKHRTLNDPIRAHPPGKLKQKAYEFSKRIPPILHFELVACRELQIDVLQKDSLDSKDIGLYFFPSDSERAEDYFSLLESIMKKDMALRNQIGDVELLLFSSKLLSPDCQRWNGEYYLWGLFHLEKQDKNAYHCNRALTSFVGSSHEMHENFDDDNGEAVEMEIDMIGGENVGQTDIVVPRAERRLASTATTSHGKRENDYPPGFEAHLPRVQRLAPLVKSNAKVASGVKMR